MFGNIMCLTYLFTNLLKPKSSTSSHLHSPSLSFTRNIWNPLTLSLRWRNDVINSQSPRISSPYYRVHNNNTHAPSATVTSRFVLSTSDVANCFGLSRYRGRRDSSAQIIDGTIHSMTVETTSTFFDSSTQTEPSPQFENNHYHEECLRCNSCGINLTGPNQKRARRFKVSGRKADCVTVTVIMISG